MPVTRAPWLIWGRFFCWFGIGPHSTDLRPREHHTFKFVLHTTQCFEHHTSKFVLHTTQCFSFCLPAVPPAQIALIGGVLELALRVLQRQSGSKVADKASVLDPWSLFQPLLVCITIISKGSDQLAKSSSERLMGHPRCPI